MWCDICLLLALDSSLEHSGAGPGSFALVSKANASRTCKRGLRNTIQQPWQLHPLSDAALVQGTWLRASLLTLAKFAKISRE